MSRWIFISISFFLLRPVFAQQSLNEFLNYFGASCSIRGEHTREAIQSVQFLINTLDGISKNKNCRPLTEVVSSLKIVERNLLFHNSNSNIYQRTALALENRRLEILNLLNQSNSQEENEILLADLRTTQLNLSENYSYASSGAANSTYENKENSLSDTLSATHSIFNALQNAQSCWLKYPSVLQQVSGIATALGQTYSLGVLSSTSVPYSSAAIQFGAQIVSYFFNLKDDRKIKKLIKTIEPTALYCSIETLTNQYCSARDTVTSVHMVIKAFQQSTIKNSLAALQLIDREVATLTQWLEEVRAGSPAQNAGYARTRSNLRSKESQLQQTKDTAEGTIADYKKRMAQVSDKDAERLIIKKYQLQKEAILVITNEVFGTCYSESNCTTTNPLGSIFSTSDSAAYYLVGNKSPALDSNGNPKDFKGSFNPLSPDWNGSGPFNPDIEVVEQRFADWYDQANSSFTNEKNLVIQDDPFLPFSKALPKNLSGHFKGLSVRESLRTLLEFLHAHQEDAVIQNSLHLIYKDTKDRLSKILATIDAVISGQLDPNIALSEVTSLANLNNGTSFLQSRLVLFIRTIMEDYILKQSSNQERLVLLSSFDNLQVLKRISGSQSIQAILNDAKNSQQILQSAMLELSDLFKNEIKESILNYSKLSKQTQERSSEDPNNYMKTLFCLNLLSLPTLPKTKDISACLGVELKSPFKVGPEKIVFTEEQVAKEFLERVCLYRDFRRKNDVYQSLIESKVLYQ